MKSKRNCFSLPFIFAYYAFKKFLYIKQVLAKRYAKLNNIPNIGQIYSYIKENNCQNNSAIYINVAKFFKYNILIGGANVGVIMVNNADNFIKTNIAIFFQIFQQNLAQKKRFRLVININNSFGNKRELRWPLNIAN